MRPADMLVRAASGYRCNIELVKDGQSVDAKSILGILTLGAVRGSELQLRAEGPDATTAIEALAEMFDKSFNEVEGDEVASPNQSKQ